MGDAPSPPVRSIARASSEPPRSAGSLSHGYSSNMALMLFGLLGHQFASEAAGVLDNHLADLSRRAPADCQP